MSLSGQSNPTRNTDISNFKFYALAISGGLPNTLSADSVGNRLLECLDLNGQVIFPLTYKNLTVDGISTTLSSANYRFTVVGFDNSPLDSALKISELFAGSPSLKVFVLAQASADTAKGQVALMPSYTASTPDKISICPPQSSGQPLKHIYQGYSGIQLGALAFNPNEAGYPPLNQGGSTTKTEVGNLLGDHDLYPSNGGDGNHETIDLLFDTTGITPSTQNIQFTVAASGGQPNTIMGGACSTAALSTAGFKMGLWDNAGNIWHTGMVSDDNLTFRLTLTNVTLANLAISGYFLATIRSTYLAYSGNGWCSRLHIDSAQLRIF